MIELILGFMMGLIFTIFYVLGHDVIANKTKKKPIIRVKRFHFHHSLYGIALIFASFFIIGPILFGTGLGIIFKHTRDEKKFTFIDKS